jgi:hypothetical protein
MAARHARHARTVAPGGRVLGPVLVAAAVVAILGAVSLLWPTGRARQGRSALQPAVSSSSAQALRSTVTHGSPLSPSAPESLAAASWLAPITSGAGGHLRPGSTPSALPAPLLIADKLNNRLVVVDPQGRVRWQFPRHGDLRVGQTFQVPDDAFFTPDARYIIATQEDQAVITLIDIAAHRIVYRYGVPGQPGMGPNHLDNPDDAMVLPNGEILSADIKNCRIVLIAPGAHRPLHVLGLSTQACLHDPPRRWGSPNGVFPMANTHYLVTEINGDCVDEIVLDGTVYWSTHAPGVTYPSDTNQIGADRYLTVDYAQPGQAVIFDHRGRKLWSYQGSGSNALDHPSLALGLPNGDVVLNDDYNHRVIVIDPRTNHIVWQYGVTGIAGAGPGYLDNPDGIDLVPPHSLLVTHAGTMGSWP